MRWAVTVLLSVLLTLGLSACGGTDAPSGGETDGSPAAGQEEEIVAEEMPEAPETGTEEAPPVEGTDDTDPSEGETPLVLYFSRVGNTSFPEDVDAVASASVIRRDGELVGNAQLLAMWIADEIGGDLWEIQTEDPYPIDYRETTEAALQEQRDAARPALRSALDEELLSSHNDTIWLVFPNWWGSLPMPLFTFFEENDFAGKTLKVSITHGGSSFAGTLETIQDLEPEATVIRGVSVEAESVPDAEERVRAWAREDG